MTPENETKLRHAILQAMLDNKEAIMRNKLAYPDDKIVQGYNDRMAQEQSRLKKWLELMDEKPTE